MFVAYFDIKMAIFLHFNPKCHRFLHHFVSKFPVFHAYTAKHFTKNRIWAFNHNFNPNNKLILFEELQNLPNFGTDLSKKSLF